MNFYYYDILLLTSLLLYMYIGDTILCFLFSNKARYYQLHSLTNSIILLDITPDLIDIFKNPQYGYRLLNNHHASYLILALHIYHVLSFNNLTFYDYFHHVLFVLFGVVPVIFYINYNQIYLGYLACSGLPGLIEYTRLALYKNNKLSLLRQKEILTNVYIYIRLPLCIFGVTMNYVAHINNYIHDSLYLTFYINFLLYLNGTLFTHLTVDSHYKYKYTPIKPRVFP